MKKLNLTIIALAILIICPSISFAQWSLSGNTANSGDYLGVNNNVVLEFRRNSNTVMQFDEYDNIKLGVINSFTPSFSNSVIIGKDNSISQHNSFAIGQRISIDNPDLTIGDNSFAIGYDISTRDPQPFFAIGRNIDPSAGGFVIGDGVYSLGPNTFAIGLNSNLATFFISPSNGWNTTGNVGIATTTPTQKLDINGGLKIGNTTTASNGSLRYNNNDFEGYANGNWVSLTAGSDWLKNGNNVYANNTGNVGIGTSTPENNEGWDKVLNVHGTLHSKIIATTTTGSIQTGMWSHCIGFYGATAGGVIGTRTNHNFSFVTNASSRMMISNTGNIGINTNNPSERLDVAGAIKLNGFPVYFLAGSSDPHYLIKSGEWNVGMEYRHYGGHRFFTGVGNEQMRIFESGKVAIGTVTTPGNYRLYVQDGILAEKVKVAVKNTSNWADYVFADNYQLKSLKDVEKFIISYKHLPDVPSAEDVVKNGVDMAEMDALLLQKIEELTLYMIEQNKRIEKLEQENKSLKK